MITNNGNYMLDGCQTLTNYTQKKDSEWKQFANELLLDLFHPHLSEDKKSLKPEASFVFVPNMTLNSQIFNALDYNTSKVKNFQSYTIQSVGQLIKVTTILNPEGITRVTRTNINAHYTADIPEQSTEAQHANQVQLDQLAAQQQEFINNEEFQNA